MSEMLQHPIKTVKGPGKPKPAVLILGVAGIGAVGFVAYRRLTYDSSAATPADDSTSDDASTDTGYTDANDYGDDYSSAGYGSSGGAYSGALPVTDNTPATDSDTGDPVDDDESDSPYPDPPTTKPQWFQQAIENLEDDGYTPEAAAAALGKYLAGAPLSDAQVGAVQVALGSTGDVPGGNPRVRHAPPAGNTKPSRTKPKPHPKTPTKHKPVKQPKASHHSTHHSGDHNRKTPAPKRRPAPRRRK